MSRKFSAPANGRGKEHMARDRAGNEDSNTIERDTGAVVRDFDRDVSAFVYGVDRDDAFFGLLFAGLASGLASRLAPALLSVREVFGTDLATDPRFASSIETALDRLFTRGARETVAALAHQAPD